MPDDQPRKGPNPQNIPIRAEGGTRIRELFLRDGLPRGLRLTCIAGRTDGPKSRILAPFDDDLAATLGLGPAPETEPFDYAAVERRLLGME